MLVKFTFLEKLDVFDATLNTLPETFAVVDESTVLVPPMTLFVFSVVVVPFDVKLDETVSVVGVETVPPLIDSTATKTLEANTPLQKTLPEVVAPILFAALVRAVVLKIYRI
jgi:hypothetical protein